MSVLSHRLPADGLFCMSLYLYVEGKKSLATISNFSRLSTTTPYSTKRRLVIQYYLVGPPFFARIGGNVIETWVNFVTARIFNAPHEQLAL